MTITSMTGGDGNPLLPSVAKTYLGGYGGVHRPAPAALRQADADTIDQIHEAFDIDALSRICTMAEDEFSVYCGDRIMVRQPAPHDYYYFQDNGSDILAVAHLDSCEQFVRFDSAETAAGTVIYSGSLDDRLGAYVILELMPKLGITCDILLTTGEELGRSTAAFFEPPHDRQYNWIIQFDRGHQGGNGWGGFGDVVMYDFETPEYRRMVQACGVKVGMGSFSDICMLENLGCAAFNWGVGYRDYHGPKSHVWLDDLVTMVEAFVYFWDTHHNDYLPHEIAPVYVAEPKHRDWKFDGNRVVPGRYNGVMHLKGDRVKSRTMDDDGEGGLQAWLERHQEEVEEGEVNAAAFAERDAPPTHLRQTNPETCLGCMNVLASDGYCIDCDDWPNKKGDE